MNAQCKYFLLVNCQWRRHLVWQEKINTYLEFLPNKGLHKNLSGFYIFCTFLAVLFFSCGRMSSMGVAFSYSSYSSIELNFFRMDWKGHFNFWCGSKNATNLARFWGPDLLWERQRVWFRWLSGIFFERPRPDFHSELYSNRAGLVTHAYENHGHCWNSIQIQGTI